MEIGLSEIGQEHAVNGLRALLLALLQCKLTKRLVRVFWWCGGCWARHAGRLDRRSDPTTVHG